MRNQWEGNQNRAEKTLHRTDLLRDDPRNLNISWLSSDRVSYLLLLCYRNWNWTNWAKYSFRYSLAFLGKILLPGFLWYRSSVKRWQVKGIYHLSCRHTRRHYWSSSVTELDDWTAGEVAGRERKFLSLAIFWRTNGTHAPPILISSELKILIILNVWILKHSEGKKDSK